MSPTIIAFPLSQPPIQKPVKVPVWLRTLASGLMFTLHIYPDRSLVAVLGHGKEHSNHDAIISWLKNHVEIEQIEAMCLPHEELSEVLYRYLNDQLSNQEYLSC